MAPFSYLINEYGADLAILWVDSHPDMGTGESGYPGFHAMVVSALTGRGDEVLLEMLPATTTADRVALVGMHDWTDPMLPAIAAEWGLSVFSPDALRSSSAPLLDWLGTIGASKVAIHFDVDTIDAEEIQLGLSADLAIPDGTGLSHPGTAGFSPVCARPLEGRHAGSCERTNGGPTDQRSP
jgi:arginase